MKIEIHQTNKKPFKDVEVGEIFAHCVPKLCKEVSVYMKLKEIDLAVSLYPEKYQGIVSSFDSETKVIEVISSMRIDNMPNFTDFEEENE